MNAVRRSATGEFIRHFAAAVSTATLYPLEHAQVTMHLGGARRELERALADREEISLMRLEETLVADGTPLASGLYLQRFVRILKERGIGHLRIGRAVAQEELLALAGALAGRLGAEGEIRSTENLRLGKVSAPPVGSSLAVPELPPEGMTGIDGEDFARLAEIYERARRSQSLSTVGISEIVSNFIRALASDADPLLVLAPLRKMDEYTFAHSVNSCLLNLAQARSLGVEGPLLRDIGVAALLHDIGKLFIPGEIINKPGKLDESEWKIVRRHPALGARYLLGARGIPRLAVLVAYEHHLRFDCSGYPAVDEDWQQNLCSHLTAISDIVDSMLTRRSYREPLSFEMVTGTIRGYRGTHLHPLLVDNFLKLTEWGREEVASPS